MYEQDYIMRLISEIIRTILKLVFRIDVKKEEEIEFKSTEAAKKYDLLLDLIDAGKINEAENMLLEGMDDKDMDRLEMALMFYSYLNEKSDEFLEQCNYSRLEIAEGITNISKQYGCESLTTILLDLL